LAKDGPTGPPIVSVVYENGHPNAKITRFDELPDGAPPKQAKNGDSNMGRRIRDNSPFRAGFDLPGRLGSTMGDLTDRRLGLFVVIAVRRFHVDRP
jgi:hypothetical protein